MAARVASGMRLIAREIFLAMPAQPRMPKLMGTMDDSPMSIMSLHLGEELYMYLHYLLSS